jgi:ABC-type branched-subunit amino acid transport system permease subunit
LVLMGLILLVVVMTMPAGLLPTLREKFSKQ